MKYTDDYADNKEDQQFIDNERLRHIVERNKVLYGDKIMGDEADRLIEKQIYSWSPLADERTATAAHKKPYKLTGVITNSMLENDKLQNVRLHNSNASIIICSVKRPMKIGTVVTVDDVWNAEPLATGVVDTTVLYEGFNDDTHSNEHPSAVVTTDVTCSYCQQTGLHWSGKKGVSLCLRDSNGFKHDCGRSKVTINL